MRIKRKDKTWPKVVFMATATLIAVGSGAVFFYGGMTIASAEVESVSDISGNFGRNVGITETSQEPTVSETGMTGTTIKSISDGNIAAPPLPATLSYVSKTISNVAGNEIVNFELESITQKGTVSLKYYASSPDDYENGNFGKVVSFFGETESLGLKNLQLVIHPSDVGRYIEIVGSPAGYLSEKTNSYMTMQKNLVRVADTFLEREYGDVFDITLAIPADETHPVDMSVQTLIDSDYTYDRTINFSAETWTEILTFATSDKYDFLGRTGVHFYAPLKANSGKLTFIIPEDTPEVLATKVAGMTPARHYDYAIYVPRPYDISMKYSADGIDQAFIPSYYAN